jgi:hypothetical protein
MRIAPPACLRWARATAVPIPDQPVRVGIDGLRPGRRIAGGIGVRRRRVLAMLRQCHTGN